MLAAERTLADGETNMSKAEIDKELEALENGCHNGYKRKAEILEKRHKSDLMAVEAKRKERLRHVNIMYEAELKAAKDDLQYQKESLFLEMQNMLKEKKRKILLEDKGLQAMPNMRTRKRTRPSMMKPKETTARGMRFTLSMDEIKRDIALMKKPFQAHGRDTVAPSKKRRTTRTSTRRRSRR
uniref:Uncharacterized protein n=1 Tax=Lotharella globosa TaxID=91324 RepID=A0A7S3ZG54_9EUKA